MERINAQPLTELQAAKAFGITGYSGLAYVAGYRHTIYVSPENSHFTNINVLGADFVNANISISQRNFNAKTEKLYFNNNWEVKPKL